MLYIVVGLGYDRNIDDDKASHLAREVVMEIRGSKIEPAVAPSLGEALRVKMADSDSVMAAWKLAAWCHAEDVRSGGEPYISHPARVASRVLVWAPQAPEDFVAAALMHDTVEDHPSHILSVLDIVADGKEAERSMRERIEHHIVSDQTDSSLMKVLGIVLHLSNPVMPRSASREERNASYWSHLSEHVVDNPGALIIKCSDFVDNAGSLTQMKDGARASRMAVKYAHAGRILLAGLESVDSSAYGPSFDSHAVKNAVAYSVETAQRMR